MFFFINNINHKNQLIKLLLNIKNQLKYSIYKFFLYFLDFFY
jgi:hypothetical protein